MNLAYRVALVCGALPLLSGISIFMLWLVTRWNWLMAAGFCTIYGGVVLLLVGVIALVHFWGLAYEKSKLPIRRLRLLTFACAGLLLSNFLVGGGIIAAAIAIETRYTVVVHNASEQPLENVRVFGGGCDQFLGAIPPGATVRKSFWIQCDGELRLSALHGATNLTETIDGYVTNGMGAYTTVTINPDGTISVSNDYT